ncbi:MAG: glutamine-hydrolyzing GMP synthase [Bryobacterales bacterium]|nr:glutamine-hydrolyzing GMP synthase [Bryobacterales bacterium]
MHASVSSSPASVTPVVAQAAVVAQAVVLDTGGQYCHLIARKIRELGIYSEVKPSETPATELAGARAIIISGGPSSVYDPGSPTVDPAIFGSSAAVLGICYGLQLAAYLLGGKVEKVDRGEYGRALLSVHGDSPLVEGWQGKPRQVWMSHRDTVVALPEGFTGLATTDTCPFAAAADEARRVYGVQFHPEVVHTHEGMSLLRNFLFGIAGCARDWDPSQVVDQLEEEIRQVVGERNVFFFISGGVDSTVAYTLCLRALGADRVRGIYVDTGLMRKGETRFVRDLFGSLGGGASVHVAEAEPYFLEKLEGVVDPEAKRHCIGQEFLEVQNRILETEHFLDGNWILGQGTIYPDTIESGGTAKADLIKTHHNRVEGIQRLMAENRIVEPLHNLYKDEVREVGAQLGIPHAFLHRHPFPGPGLAIRCLCAAEAEAPARIDGGWLLPLRSVGVQGDSRSYKPVLLMDLPDSWPSGGWETAYDQATHLINANDQFNRVVLEPVRGAIAAELCNVRPSSITRERLDRLRDADALVREVCLASGFEHEVWQFPVILAPYGTEAAPDSIVLRPIQSVDGMTAQSVGMPFAVLRGLCEQLLALPGIATVLYDLTHKPPGTIEWE